mgnify:CR=1 FL=1
MKERNEIDPALFSTGAHILEKSNNGTKYQIECNYRLALKRADELSETARNIMKVSENFLE